MEEKTCFNCKYKELLEGDDPCYECLDRSYWEERDE